MHGTQYNVCYAIDYRVPGEGEKTRWVTIGRAFETKRGLKVKLDAVPLNFDGEMMLFERNDGYGKRGPTLTETLAPPPEPAPEPMPAPSERAFPDEEMPF